ncbi:MAG: LytTR family DNA-binding domain-containing protein [Bacteroidota bacterium]
MKIQCLIVDDEPLALDILESYVQRLDSLALVGRCENAIEAFNLLQKHPVDLLFLDIQMPKLTGIDFLKNIRNPPKVIFTTAFREYAIESYELNAVDYLLKPIPFERFLRAVNKVVQHTIPNPSTAPSPHDTAPDDAFIYLKADKKMVKVMLREIIYLESLKDYIRVKTATKEIISLQKISFLEEKLPEGKFLRIHRSFIIAVDKIQAFSATHVELAGNKEIPIGRNYKAEVLQALGKSDWLND